jgi:hypothetical protein
MDDEQKTFTFKNGMVVSIRFVPYRFIARVRAAAQDKATAEFGTPEVPTYTVKAAGGSEYVNEHTAESVEREPYADDEEVQAEWQAYQTASRAIDIAVQSQTCRAYALRGVIDDVPDSWIEEQAYWDLDVPDDPRDRKWDWIFDNTSGWDEILDLVIAIQRINPIEEVAAAVEESFRNSVGAPGAGPDAGSGEEAAGGSGTE